ncbi:hypothetical protein AUJ46_06540 [Candidatus Peregrinibacteria bacterium CG1_02_54_53]|nr:MAG: hypothetical protein AUJ46_06540 [Candidatus Peregrinibacteria bacterium CG1_02_54_53]
MWHKRRFTGQKILDEANDERRMPANMEQLPHRGRPVTEENEQEGVISPDIVKRLQSLLKEPYRQRPTWRKFLPPQRPPRHKEVRIKLSEMENLDALQGVKVLYLDDTSQFHLEFVSNLTLATRRRVERIFYHGESTVELVKMLRSRLSRCPRVHLLIADGCLELLPSMEDAGRSIRGYRVIDSLKDSLRRAGVPAIGYSSNPDFNEYFTRAGADGFICKTENPLDAVRTINELYPPALAKVRQRREQEFIQTD